MADQKAMEEVRTIQPVVARPLIEEALHGAILDLACHGTPFMPNGHSRRGIRKQKRNGRQGRRAAARLPYCFSFSLVARDCPDRTGQPYRSRRP